MHQSVEDLRLICRSGTGNHGRVSQARLEEAKKSLDKRKKMLAMRRLHVVIY
jgi:hypothetical protein